MECGRTRAAFAYAEIPRRIDQRRREPQTASRAARAGRVRIRRVGV
jgi:hypothetical protein